MRFVLDTNVVVSAFFWSGAPQRILRAGNGGSVTLLTSAPLLAELTEVLSRAKFKQKIAASRLSVDELVDLYAALAGMVRPLSIPRTAPDPDDDVVIATALAANADFIVTGDRTLIDVERYDGGRIVTVAEAWQTLEILPPRE
jgi:putative PIN family toxin of toxin-antitoxin system